MKQVTGIRGAWRRGWGAVVPVLGYLTVMATCLVRDDAPCVFWTMVMPLIPAIIVVGGFHTWRRICPLAAVGRMGAKLAVAPKRAPRGLDAFVMPLSLALLVVCLAIRLIATNGDPFGLACMLAVLGLCAVLVNARYGGRTWCNYLCPVGVVERIYTDAGPLRRTASSSCSSCVGCKRVCPDIDASRAYDRTALTRQRRLAWYAFPGIVVAFYGYYPLRHGSWDAYFDGRWTRAPIEFSLLTGSGFAVAPGIPAFVAAPLTLLVGALITFALFRLVEHAVTVRRGDPIAARHRVLAVASFTAFCSFYWFAGQPSLQFSAWAAPAVRIGAIALGGTVLIQRLRRRRVAVPRRRRTVPLPIVV